MKQGGSGAIPAKLGLREYGMKRLIISLCLIALLFQFSLDGKAVDVELSSQPVSEAAEQLQILMPIASGYQLRKNSEVEIDYSNVAFGYVMVRYLVPVNQELRVLITTPNKTVYTYRLEYSDQFDVFPLSEGDGIYNIGIYKQSRENKYANILSLLIDVKLSDEFAPFLHPNKFVNFNSSSLILEKTAEFKALDDNQAVIDAVHKFIVDNMHYNKELADNLDTWYIPDIDRIYSELTGTCFDYAVLMVAMLRSLGLPAKLVFGHTRINYHAWVEVYTESTGWVRKDPMIESVGKIRMVSIQFIKNDNNYKPMYRY